MVNDGHLEHLDLLLHLITRECTLEAVQGLLRAAKKMQPEVKISGDNKAEVVEGNLREALTNDWLAFAQVFDLLRDAEEHGGQHLFLYRSRTKTLAKRLSRAQDIAEALWGKDWAKTQGFPRLLDRPPQDPTWSDFRVLDSGWVAKVYCHAVRYEVLGEDEEVGIDPDDGAIIFRRRYKRNTQRTVLLARYRTSLDVLELRVPTWTSRKVVRQSLKHLWDLLTPALTQRDVIEWSLTDACTYMVREENRYGKVYDLCDTLLRDSGRGSVTVSPQDDFGTLFDVVERRAAIEAVLQNQQSRSEQLVVTFKKTTTTEALKGPLRVVVGANDLHEVVIGAKTTPKAVDYVIHRLFEFTEEAS